MRKLAGVLMVFVLLWACAWAQGETIGFGRINKDEVNVRKAPGEEYIFRAERGQNVFILGSETDAKGQEWYHVIIYRRPVQNGSRTEGWVMGRYVDVTDEASRDIVKVALNKNGYMALHEDGTVSGAEVGFFDSEELANLLSGLRDVRDIGVGLRTYVAAGKNGALWQWGIRRLLDGEQPYTALPVRLIASNLNVGCAFVTATGELLLGGTMGRLKDYTFLPDGLPAAAEIEQIACYNSFLLLVDREGRMHAGSPWDSPSFGLEQWTNLSCADICIEANHMGLSWASMRLIGVRRDGIAIAWPEALQAQISGWTGLTDAKVGGDFVLGLRTDGTVLCAGNSTIAAQVSAWEKIASVETADTYCAAVTADGRVLFAGSLSGD